MADLALTPSLYDGACPARAAASDNLWQGRDRGSGLNFVLSTLMRRIRSRCHGGHQLPARRWKHARPRRRWPRDKDVAVSEETTAWWDWAWL